MQLPFNFDQPSYIHLRSIVSERTSKLVAWVGSGLSQRAGLPSWVGLRIRLQDAAEQANLTFSGAEYDRRRSLLKEIKEEVNPWVAFLRLQNLLGKTTFRTEIRSALSVSNSSAVPLAYKRLWELPIRGVLSLNLDSLVARSFVDSRRDQYSTRFVGTTIEHFAHALNSPHSFIAQLHGTLEDQSSWVFTHDDLNRVISSDAYRMFVQSCLATHTTVFVGIDVQDIAVGGFLADLQRIGFETGPHFWITSDASKAQEDWAQKVGIEIIRYAPQSNEHGEIDAMLEDLVRHIPVEPNVLPVSPTNVIEPVKNPTIPDPIDLAKLPHEEIRHYLNQEAFRILDSNNETKLQQYDDFCRKYEACIYQAWFVSVNEPYNKLLGFEIESKIGEGAFSTVYKAKTDLGESVALKLVKPDVHSRPEMLQSFRRGVRSMKILSSRKVNGMVPYGSTAELPPFVTMELVDGPNLKEVVDNIEISDWASVIKIGHEIAKVLRDAHHLPERVLHRDVRPSNVMLKGFRTQSEWEVVLLDFDLSWHKDAAEGSIVKMESFSGFLAPELIERPDGVSTRSALVDSFGLGMTLFYLRTRKDPRYTDHRLKDWESDVRHAIGRYECSEWNSLPARFSRLVLETTKDNQHQRIDMTDILSELTRLREVLTTGETTAGDMLAEEVLSRSHLREHYKWNKDKACASVRLLNGLEIHLNANDSERRVQLTIEWRATEAVERGGMGKYIHARKDKIVNILSESWEITSATTPYQAMYVDAEITASKLLRNMDKCSGQLNEIYDSFSR